MGFPCLCYCVLLPEPIFLILQMLDHLRYIVTSLFFFFRLGVGVVSSDSVVESFPLTSSSTVDCSLIMPHHQSASAIKSRLRPVKLANLLRARAPENRIIRDDRNNNNRIRIVCAVCLGQLHERHDEVRELGNCCHLFHRECIDKWLDLGKLTCPLCRSPLLRSYPYPNLISDGHAHK